MTEFSHDLDGLDEQIVQLEHEQEQWAAPEEPWFVGTAVEYSVYLEFGTSKMDPKPFFRPALHEAESKGIEAFIRENTKTSVDSIDSMDELVQSLAFALERRVKEIITQKGLIDTGTLRASVQAVPGSPSGLPSADEVGASADVEVSA